MIVYPRELEEEADDEGLVLAVLLAAQFVHDGEEEDYFVTLVE